MLRLWLRQGHIPTRACSRVSDERTHTPAIRLLKCHRGIAAIGATEHPGRHTRVTALRTSTRDGWNLGAEKVREAHTAKQGRTELGLGDYLPLQDQPVFRIEQWTPPNFLLHAT